MVIYFLPATTALPTRQNLFFFTTTMSASGRGGGRGRGRGRPPKEVTPVAKRARPNSMEGMSDEGKKLYTALETVLTFENESSDSQLIRLIADRIGKLTDDKDVINELYDALLSTMNERNEEAKEEKDKLKDLAAENPITPTQKDLIAGLKNMEEQQLNQFAGFLSVAREMVRYLRITSDKLNPHYHHQEIIKEALDSFQETDTSNAFAADDIDFAHCSQSSSTSAASSSSGLRSGLNGMGLGNRTGYRNTTESQDTDV